MASLSKSCNELPLHVVFVCPSAKRMQREERAGESIEEERETESLFVFAHAQLIQVHDAVEGDGAVMIESCEC